jgi:glycosyltransferase involved in cell wall biosynthesis
MHEKHALWLALAVCIALTTISIAMAIALIGYLTLPSRPESLCITVINPPNSSLVLELASIEISKSGDTAPSVLVTIRNTGTALHSGRIKVVAYRVRCGKEVVAYGETAVEVPPNRTATAIVQLNLRQGYRAKDIDSIVVALNQTS